MRTEEWLRSKMWGETLVLEISAEMNVEGEMRCLGFEM